MEIVFSEMEEDDLVACSELFAATFGRPPWNENWNTEDAFMRLSDFLATPNAIAIKALHGGALCAFLMGEIQQWRGTRFFYLTEMCVGQKFQRKGIGKRLMGRLEDILKETGATRIFLMTQRDSVPSRFYAALGFYENPDLLVMGKEA